MTVYTILPEDDQNLEVTVTDPNDPRISILDDLNQNVTVTEQLITIDITPAAVNITSAVLSVNNLTGNVVLDTDLINEGTTNLYYTDARADARVDLQTGANLDLSFQDTDDLAEGPTNLYYTNARVDGHLTGGTGVTYNAGDISIGQDVCNNRRCRIQYCHRRLLWRATFYCQSKRNYHCRTTCLHFRTQWKHTRSNGS